MIKSIIGGRKYGKRKSACKNPIGVHLRPAGDIAEAAIKYKNVRFIFHRAVVL